MIAGTTRNRKFVGSHAKGIFRPRQMSRGVLCVRTVIPRLGRIRRYEGIASDEGFFEDRFTGADPHSADNGALKEAMDDQSPDGRRSGTHALVLSLLIDNGSS